MPVQRCWAESCCRAAVRSAGEFPRAPCRRRDGPTHQRFEAVFSHQHLKRRLGGAAWAGHALAQGARRLARGAGKLTGAGHRGKRQAVGQRRGQPGIDARRGEALDQQEDVGPDRYPRRRSPGPSRPRRRPTRPRRRPPAGSCRPRVASPLRGRWHRPPSCRGAPAPGYWAWSARSRPPRPARLRRTGWACQRQRTGTPLWRRSRGRRGSPPPSPCGLTATTTTSGTKAASRSAGPETTRTPFLDAESAAGAAGSTTAISAAARPCSSQPPNMAAPIFPQPTSRMRSPMVSSSAPPIH